MKMWRKVRPVEFLSLAALLSFGARISHAQQVSGTYRLLICRETSCNTSSKQLVARGVLVLTDSSYSSSQVSARVGVPLGSAFMPEPLNGCFALRRIGRHPRSLAGMDRIGAIIWTRTRHDSLELLLHRTPDASYTVALTIVASDTLRGVGVSHAADIPPDSLPVDRVLATRTGPPQFQSCNRQ